jgi:hypothetical protein
MNTSVQWTWQASTPPTWDNKEDETDNRKVVAKKKSSDSSLEEDNSSNDGYCFNRGGMWVRSTWRDIKNWHLVELFHVREEGGKEEKATQIDTTEKANVVA